MNNIQRLVIIIVVLVVIVAVWLLVGRPTAQPEQEQEQTKDQEQENFLSFLDQPSQLNIFYPKEWQDKINISQIEQAQEEEKRIIKMEYLAQDGQNQLVFFVSVYPKTKEVWAINSEPNNELVIQSQNNIFSVSQALDIPYQPDTEDFKNYVAITEQMQEVIGRMVIKDQAFARAKKIFQWDEQKRAEINAYYPFIEQAQNKDKINQDIKSIVDEMTQTFQSQLVDWQDIPDSMPDARSGLWINFKSYLFNQDKVSLRLLISDYFAMAAHPNNRSLPLNYDLSTGEEIQLGDLFKVDQQEYLVSLSEITSADIAKQYDERGFGQWDEFWQTGAEPKIENFDNFVLLQDSLIFIFDTYQVGPHAAGEFQSIVTFAQIADIIK